MHLMDDARLLRIEVLEAKLQYLQRLIEQHGEALDRLHGVMSESRPTLRDVIEAVSDFYVVTPKELAGASRLHDIVKPRLIVYYLAYKLTRLSLPQIGQRLGERDHTTVLNGYRRIEALLRSNTVLRDDVDELRARVATKVAIREALRMNPVLLLGKQEAVHDAAPDL